MKRSLLLLAVAALALLVPTDASACTWICESAFGPCIYEVNTSSYCWLPNGDEGACWMFPCRSSTPERPELLSSKYKIASIEIEHRNPADTRDGEIRVASKTKSLPLKSEGPSLE